MAKSRIGSYTVFLLLRILFEKEVRLITQVIDSRRHVKITRSSVALVKWHQFTSSVVVAVVLMRRLVKAHWCRLIWILVLRTFWLLFILVWCINDSDDLSFFFIDTLRFFVIFIYNCCGLNRWHILCHLFVRRDRLFFIPSGFRRLVFIPSYFLAGVQTMGAEASRVLFIVTLIFIVEHSVRRVAIVLAACTTRATT